MGLGGGLPIENLSAMVSSQGVRTFAADLPDNVTGVEVHHRSIRPAVLVNHRHAAPARRFSMAHEYAHALLDRKVSVTKRENSDELIEKRANAFGAAVGETYRRGIGWRAAVESSRTIRYMVGCSISDTGRARIARMAILSEFQ